MSTLNNSQQGAPIKQKNHAEDNSHPDKGVSICVPFIFNNITHWRVKNVFIELGWGYVDRVDIVRTGFSKRAYVHFAPGKWNTWNKEATEALAAMKRGDEVKIVYDAPWHWKIGLSRAMKPAEAPKPKPRTVVSIVAKADAGKGARVQPPLPPGPHPADGKCNICDHCQGDHTTSKCANPPQRSVKEAAASAEKAKQLVSAEVRAELASMVKGEAGGSALEAGEVKE